MRSLFYMCFCMLLLQCRCSIVLSYSISDKSKELHVDLQLTVSYNKHQRLPTSSSSSVIYHCLVAGDGWFVVWQKSG